MEFPPSSHLDRTTSYETEEAAKSYKFNAVRVAAAALGLQTRLATIKAHAFRFLIDPFLSLLFVGLKKS